MVQGNYYSVRSYHIDAIKYFKRAVDLDPTYDTALTLMGHEYIEMKNAQAAITAYRQTLGTGIFVVEEPRCHLVN